MSRELPKPDLELIFDHYGARILGHDNGGWRKAECPLNDHEDRNPSASVNTTECRWRCFSCDKSGDAIDLVQENEGLDFKASVEFARKFLNGSEVDNRSQPRSGLTVGAGKRSGGKWTPPWASL